MYWGTLGGLVGGVGLTCMQNAMIRGPGGPIFAITSMSSPCLVVIEALVNWKMVSSMELLACIFGLFGSIIITNPNLFMKCFFCFYKKEQTKSKEINDEQE